MTRAAWWWARKEYVAEPSILLPPDVVNPGDRTYYLGEVIDFNVDNIGGAADSWSVDQLPDGLSIQEFPYYVRIYGTVSTPIPVPVINDPGDQVGTVGEVFGLQMTASNNPTSWSAINLPDGLSINDAGLIAGIPTTDGVQQATITATNAGGDSDPLPVLFTISPAIPPVPVIDDPGDQAGTVGTSFSLQMTASNSPTSWSAINLPEGLSIDNAGLISGTPTTEEITTASITATNAGGDSSPLDVQFTISPALPPVPVINDPGPQVGEVGVAFNLQMTATNSPTSWSAINLPDGLSIDNGGLISGTPTTVEAPTASITATNAGGDSAPLDVLFTINPAVPDVVNPGPQTFYVGETISPLVINNVGGDADSWDADPLPDGLSVTNETATQLTISGRVEGPANTAPFLNDPGDQTVQVGVPFSLTIYNTGGPVDPGGWDVRVGWLPDGLDYDASDPYQLVISGTPTGL